MNTGDGSELGVGERGWH